MPLGEKPECSSCQTSNTSLWRKSEDGETVCNTCFLKPPNGNGKDNHCETERRVTRNGKELNPVGSQFVGPIRKSARLKPSKYKFQPSIKALPTKGKSRRVVFKKNPIKAPTSVATVVTSDYLFYDGIYWQVGDIASVMDDDGGIFYVQLRGFLQDQYCNRSAVITWLLPTTASQKESFDPSSYILGPEEDLPRSMECFEFVCHAPSEYYKCKNSPYDLKVEGPELGYISTTIGAQIRRLPSKEAIYGLRDIDHDEPPQRVMVQSKDKSKEKSKEKEEKKEKATKDRRERKESRDRTRSKNNSKDAQNNK